MDYDRATIQTKAREAIARHGGPDLVRVFYKWTCPQCATRNVEPNANELPERAACPACDSAITIDRAGFALNIRRSIDIDWDREVGILIRRA
jgi:hypothetical protein